MKFKVAAILSVLFMLAAGYAVAAADAVYFRYKGTLHPVSMEEPQDPAVEEPGDEDPDALRVLAQFPDILVQGESHEVGLFASGGSGGYEFSAEGLPGFADMAGAVIYLNPSASDVGEHGPFFVRVMDSDGQMAEMAVVLLVVPAGEREPMLPDSVFLRGDPVDRQVIFDGDNVTKVSLAGGDVLELVYPAPVTADGVYLSSIGSGTLSIQAFVGGQWVEAVSTSAGGSFNGHNKTFEFGRFLTSDRWRLVGHSHGGSVREFRPGPAPANPVPVFTSSAYAASLGTSRQVFATVSKVYSDAPATIMFAEGTVVPEGVELVDGVLSVAADADISTTWTFDLVAYDGVGFWSSKTFYVTPEAPDASKVMATDFRKTPKSAPEGSGAELDHKMFYDGFVSVSDDTVTVDGNEYIEIDFGGPVRYSQLRAEASSGFVLEAYESSGWVTVVDRTVGASASNTIWVSGTRVAQKFRLSSKGSSTVIRELRIGGGPSHPYPTIGVSEYISLLKGVNGSNRDLHVSRGTNYTTAPLQYEVVYGELPPGAYFTAERVFLPSLAQVGNGPWWVKVRVSDDLGFSTEKRLTIAGGVPEASSYMATDFYLEGAPEQPIDHRQFYDGESSNDAFVNLVQPLVVDFGTMVNANSFAFDQTTGYKYAIDYEWDGEWIQWGTENEAQVKRSSNRPSVAARRFRVRGINGTVRITEIRIGRGAVHESPQITSSDPFVVLHATATRSKTLSVSRSTAYTNANGPLQVEVVEGEFPEGTTFNPGNTSFTFPPIQEIGEGIWTVRLRVIDPVGFSGEKILSVVSSNTAASTWMATKFYREDNGQEFDYKPFYDGVTDTDEALLPSLASNLIVEFDRPVTASSVVLHVNKTVYLDYEALGEWHEIASLHKDLTGHNFSPVVAKRFRLRLTQTNTNVREMRLLDGDYGGIHPAPVIDRGEYILLGSSRQNLSLPVVQATPYTVQRGNFTFERVYGEFPPTTTFNGSAQSRQMNLPSRNEVEPYSKWDFTIKVSDQLGFSSEKLLTVVSDYVNADMVMPSSVKVGTTDVDIAALYDGNTSTNVAQLTAANPEMVVEFDKVVRAQAALISASSGFRLEYWSHGEWHQVYYENTSSNYYAFRSNTSTVYADKFRLVRIGTGTVSVRELRIGAGPAHVAPEITTGERIMLDSAPKTVQLAVTNATAYDNLPLVFSSTNLPAGVTLDPDGKLNLPAETALQGVHLFDVTVTDRYGMSHTKQFELESLFTPM